MDQPLRERVLGAAEAWAWVPPDAEDRVTDEYRLLLYPDRTAVRWSRTERLPQLLAELREVAADRGHELRWWVNELTTPADTVEVLTSECFEVVETLDVLGRPLDGLVEALDVPADLRVETADDEATIRLAAGLGARYFGESGPTEVQVADEVARAKAGLESGSFDVRRFVVWLDGRPVGSAGYTIEDGILRLWGGGVDEQARGRGAYRALLAARAEDGLRQGADVALVKGRVETSAPILRRAGFEKAGRETCYRDAGRAG